MNLLPRIGPASLLVLLVAAPGLGTRGPEEGPRYSIVDLGTLPGGRGTEPRVINSRGDVVGVTCRRGGPRVAFLYHHGAMIELGGSPGEAWGINDRGDVVGSATAADRGKHAFLWPAARGRGDDAPIDLGTGVARDINERGQIVGALTGGSLRNPSKSDRQSGITVRVDRGGGASRPEGNIELIAINDRGQVIGSVQGLMTEVYPVRGFVWEDGKETDLGTLGSPHCHPSAINEAGTVVGTSSYAAVPRGIAPLYLSHAFLWERGKIRDLGALAEGRNSAALGLNNKGQVVGWSETGGGDTQPMGGRRVAFLYHAGKLSDLNRLIPPDSGWELQEARAINDRGQVVGIGVRGGEVRGFILSPAASTKEGRIPRDFRIIAEYGPGGSVFGRSVAKPWRVTIDDAGGVARMIDPARPAAADCKENDPLSAADLKELLDTVRNASFFTLAGRYQQSFHEGPELRLQISANGETKEVIVFAPDLKQGNPEVKQFLAVWSEVIRKVPPPKPAEASDGR